MQKDEVQVIVPKEVVGFDLGHGETTAAKVSLEEHRSPMLVEIENRSSIFTAIGYGREGEVYIGEKALRVPGLSRRYTGLKARPPLSEERAKILADFLKVCIQGLTESGRLQGDESTHFFVGCPSGWSREELEAYRSILTASGLASLSIVRESRAALLNAKQSGDVTSVHLGSSVVVLDLGSLTTDATLVLGGTRDVPLEFGEELGGHLIEKEILKRAINGSSERDSVEAFLASEEGEAERARAEAICRGFKEDFWRRQEEYELAPERKLFSVGEYRLEIEDIAEEVSYAVRSPLPCLGGRSWVDSFARMLQQIQGHLDKRQSRPSALILTGGASRMSFVPEMCKGIFPDAKLIHSGDPERTVSFGLAWWGRVYFQTDGFSREISVYCEQRLPDLVRRYGDRLSLCIAEAIAGGVTIEIVRPALESWRNGDISTLEGLDSILQSRIAEWLESQAGKSAVQKSLGPVLSDLEDNIFRETFETCREFNVPPGALKLDLLEEIQRSTPGASVNPFDGLIAAGSLVGGIGMIVSYLVLKFFVAGAAIAAGASGPPGWAVLLSIASIGSIAGLAAMDERLKRMTIPVTVRRIIIREQGFDDTILKLKVDATKELNTQFKEEKLPELIRLITSQTKKQLDERVREVKWIID